MASKCILFRLAHVTEVEGASHISQTVENWQSANKNQGDHGVE